LTDDAPVAKAAGRLALPIVLTFSAVTLPVASLGLALAIYLPRYFASHLGVSLTVVGTAFAIVRLIDIPVDPILGHFMDRTRTAVGRYRLWLMIGAPVLMLAAYQLFMAPAGIGEAYLIAWLLVLYLGNSIVALAHTAWASTLATAYNERSRLFGVMAMVVVAGSVVVLAIPIAAKSRGISEASGVQAMGWLVIALIPLCIGLVAWRFREKFGAEARSHWFPAADYWALIRKPSMIRLWLAQLALTLGPGWMSALYLFFFKDVLGFSVSQSSGLLIVYILAAVAGAPSMAFISARLGKHRTLMIATGAYSLGLCSILVMPKNNLPAVLPVMLWCGFMASGFGMLISSMTADVGDEVRLEQGKQRISLIYSLNGLATKLAGAFSIFLTYRALAGFGYRATENAHNTPQAIHGLELAFIVGPIFFVMLGGACFIGWTLDAARHGDIRTALDARDSNVANDMSLASLAAADIETNIGLSPNPALVAKPD
jgi:GPH family glycoside/pentoside/hexuronide:cation symporter